VLIEDPKALARLGEILGRGDRLRFLSEPLHRDLVSELRFTAEATTATRTGIDVATLELSASDAAAMRVLARWPTMDMVRAFGGGGALERAARSLMVESSAVGILAIRGEAPRAFFEGGRVLENMWLEASACGLALQPYAALLYLLRRLGREGATLLSPDDARTLRALGSDLDSVLPQNGTIPLMLFRLSYADPPRAWSLRRPVEEVLRFGDELSNSG
jgi:hypothetical protein